ncbi:MAG: hypothetical protein WDN69_27000 [Aliidongia sp.]
MLLADRIDIAVAETGFLGQVQSEIPGHRRPAAIPLRTGLARQPGLYRLQPQRRRAEPGAGFRGGLCALAQDIGLPRSGRALRRGRPRAFAEGPP